MRSAVLALALVAAMIACRREEKKEDTFLGAPVTATASGTDTATHPASPGGTAVVPQATAGTTVLVSIEDGRIAITDADKIPPGPAVFTVTNSGTAVHNLFIEGAGISRAAGDPLPQGQTASIDVNLQPATYTLYCPILDHRDRGEKVGLVIKPAAAPPPTSTVITGTTATTGT